MNINIYLEDALAKNLNQMTKESKQTRNAIVREAIKEWLERHQKKKWPQSVLEFKGSRHFPAFESYREELKEPNEDPFK